MNGLTVDQEVDILLSLCNLITELCSIRTPLSTFTPCSRGWVLCASGLTRDTLFRTDIGLNRDDSSLSIFLIPSSSLNWVQPPSGDVNLASIFT